MSILQLVSGKSLFIHVIILLTLQINLKYKNWTYLEEFEYQICALTKNCFNSVYGKMNNKQANY